MSGLFTLSPARAAHLRRIRRRTWAAVALCFAARGLAAVPGLLLPGMASALDDAGAVCVSSDCSRKTAHDRS
ncbi:MULTISPECIES: hypothetical protein [unclassified Novosphingobium]|uniref:hypothetical protein n=1 Tax=unclassified Novosphingobium TaxID=2644732 RepID=UPI000F5DCFCB|nr:MULTISPECIES: hypothetical protein [unclassified Novosphingobium]RQW44489.1 hypothetical protein EH199_08500 [Novosphingobium sp. LASN5T]